MASGEHLRRSSHSFGCCTPAAPDEVWDALTNASRTRTYLHGIAVNSTWEAEATVTADYDGTIGLTGRVVCSRPGERLSYLLQAQSTDPATYLTWLIRPSPTGTTINLVIDEPDTPDTSQDAEDIWLPVLDALQRQLRSQEDRRVRADKPPLARPRPSGPDRPWQSDTAGTCTYRSPCATAVDCTTSACDAPTPVGGSSCSWRAGTSGSLVLTAHRWGTWSSIPITTTSACRELGAYDVPRQSCLCVRDKTRAEGVGFEPTEACTSRLFKSRGFVRSAIPPSDRQGSRRPATGRRLRPFCRLPVGSRHAIRRPILRLPATTSLPRVELPAPQVRRPDTSRGTSRRPARREGRAGSRRPRRRRHDPRSR